MKALGDTRRVMTATIFGALTHELIHKRLFWA
jgi:hypothetical protein